MHAQFAHKNNLHLAELEHRTHQREERSLPYIGDQWFNPNHGFMIGNSSYVVQPVTIKDGTMTMNRADQWRLPSGGSGG